MKRSLLFFAVVMLILFSLAGCTNKDNDEDIISPSPLVTETPNMQDSSEEKNALDEDNSNTEIKDDEIKKIVDLPNELYKSDKSVSAVELRYDFIVTEKTEFTIIIAIDSGEFKLGIKNKDSKVFLYPMKEFKSETDTVTLEKGNYSVVIRKNQFTGSYHITGVPTE